MQYLDRQERLFIDLDRKGAVTHGEQPGVVAVASKDCREHWSWAVYDVLQTHRGRADCLEAAEHAIRSKIAEIDALAATAANALTERQRDGATFDHERLKYCGSDAILADLYHAYNQCTDDNERRSVSHPSYHLSGAKTADDAALAALRIKIDTRKTELEMREAA